LAHGSLARRGSTGGLAAWEPRLAMGRADQGLPKDYMRR